MSPSVEPFNKAKYKALMDGLECSEIQYSYIIGTQTFRYDSEYYQKKYIKAENFIALHQNDFCKISDFELSVDASAFYPSLEPYYNTGAIPFIRVADVKERIDYENCVRIPHMGNDFSTLQKCQAGDIVLTKGGRIGTAGLIAQDSYVTRDLIYINSSKLDRKNYVLLYLFLCSKFAFSQMLRSSSMTAQPHLTITLIRDIFIKKYSDLFKDKLIEIFDLSEKQYELSNDLYHNAESQLNNLFNCGNSEGSISVKKLSCSFAVSGRLDAEYYQPKYEEYAKALKTTETVSSLCNIFDRNYLPEDMESYQYIELANVGASGEISGVETQVGKELPTRARRKVKSGQVIVSSIEGSLKSCALITNEYDDALCSTGFYVVDSDYINSETLLVLFQSEPIQALLKQRCSGTILTGISKDEFLSMPLPKVDEDIQKEIAAKIPESFALRKQSKQLLEYAKHAVEMAIEEGEDKALEWLKSKGVEC